MTKARPKCDVPGYRVVELEPVMSAAVRVFDALESVPVGPDWTRRTRTLLAEALLEMRQAGIPVPQIEVREPDKGGT